MERPTPDEAEAQRRQRALEDANHAAAGCASALQAASLGEADRDRRAQLASAHSQAADLADTLREIRGVK